MSRNRPVLALALLVLFGATLGAAAADPPAVVQRGAEIVGEDLFPVFVDVDLRDLPPAPEWQPGDPVKEVPKRRRPPQSERIEPPPGPDPLVARQRALATEALPDLVLNIAGQGYSSVNPPDTVGDVGPGYYIQSINGGSGTQVIVYDKSNGSVAAGPFAMDTLGTGNCASGLGDPIVLYDEAADRWMLSEFSSSGNRLCIYISQTADPIAGGWCAYQVTAPSFPDYPKYAVWHDAYYVTSNESSPAIYALDRENMKACGTARAAQRFTVADLSGFGFQALTPADSDDTPPPVTTPGILMRHRDTEVHGPAGLPGHDLLELWALDIDWTTPANSTLTALPSIQIAEIDSDLCGLTSFNCFPQPGSSTTLDPLREVIMFRLAYRNFPDRETLVGNLVTDVTGTNRGGVRWFELRDTGSGWALEQEGTYSIDADSRWMAGISMDVQGNIALGYNVSSTSTYPSLRLTGRLATDPPGTMSATEVTIATGSAANGSNRYGDYSAMSIDPEDGCTFWFTGQYNTSSQWSTRIGAYKFPDCSRAPDFSLAVTPVAQAVCAPASAAFDLEIGQQLGFANGVTLAVTGQPAGTSTGFSVNPVTPPGSSVLTIGNTGAASAGSYLLEVSGTSTTGTKTRQVALDLFTQAPAAPALTSPAPGAINQPLRPAFAWSGVAQAGTYRIQVATDPGFLSLVLDQGGIPGTSLTPSSDLASNTGHYWRVQADNACGNGAWSTASSFTTVPLPGDCPLGAQPVAVYSYGFEAGASGWTTPSGVGTNTWAITTTNPYDGANHYRGAGTAS
ncbi:MAG: hypothetical protein KJ058_15840, partial [Thermoanaerobaculia bacterium]|nr:hypothetical protein [Thermoanaerobaculia bacterium]